MCTSVEEKVHNNSQIFNNLDIIQLNLADCHYTLLIFKLINSDKLISNNFITQYLQDDKNDR